MYQGSENGVEIDRADWTALFAAMFLLEDGEPAPPTRGQVGDINLVVLAEVNPGHRRLEVS